MPIEGLGPPAPTIRPPAPVVVGRDVAPAAGSFGAAPPSGSRPAASVPPPLLEIRLAGGEGPAALRQKLRAALAQVLGRLHRAPERREAAIDTALAAFEPLLARTEGTTAIQLRLAQVEVAAPGGGRFGPPVGIAETALEVGLVRDGRVAAADTRLAGLSGAALPLDGQAIASGLAAARYRRPDTADAPPEAQQALTRAERLIARIRAVQDALADLRAGKTGALDALERLIRG